MTQQNADILKDIQQYDQKISELREIITSFQKGNMPLSQAVEKYKQSEMLLDTCKKTLDQFEQLFATTSVQDTATSDKDKTFEQNMKRLDDIVHILDSNTSVTLENLYQVMIEGKKLIQTCKAELDNVKHIIEYSESNK